MAGLFGALASGWQRRDVKAADVSSLTWSALFGQPNARSGVAVNVDSALKVSTVFAWLATHRQATPSSAACRR